MATMTISYDGRSNVMKHLIEAMLAAGAKMVTTSDSADLQITSGQQTVTPALRTKINKAREESAYGETIVCNNVNDMKRYFESL